MDPGLLAAALTAGAVALLCAVVSVGAHRAVVRTGNRAIWGVAAAFALLAAKNLVKAVLLAGGIHEAPLGELAFSVTDLAAVGLVAWPLLRGGR